MTSIRGSEILNNIRSSAITRNSPTPPATARIRIIFGTDGTWLARTCKSGSDIVIINPSKNEIKITSHSFLLLVILVPIRSPIGVIAISAPRVKNIIPAINSTAPIKKQSKILGEIGATEELSNNTIPTIGNTALNDSCNFSCNLLVLAIKRASPFRCLI